MARVIKAGAGGQKPARPGTRVVVDAGAKKVIGRDVYQAKQDAEHILMRAEQQRQGVVSEGKKLAARAREEAMARGASEAFSLAAAEALTAFRKRAERYAEASDDVRVLALEVVKKILGNDPDLGPAKVDRILQRGMALLRARRRLRLQVSHKRLGELAGERPNLMRALQSEPDLVIEGVDDVSAGFARVVTEIGGALCAEGDALDALSMAVNVKETPRDGRGRPVGGNTAVGDGPNGLSDLRASSRNGSNGSSIPDAAAGDVRSVAAMEDETINLPAKGLVKRPRQRTEEIEVIAAHEDEEDEPTDSRVAARVPAGQVQVRGGTGRPTTRVVAIDSPPPSREDSDATIRHTPVIDRPKDEDLDLFTDDAPRKRR